MRLVLLLAAVCLSVKDSLPVTPILLNYNPSVYGDRKVEATGWLGFGPEESVLLQSKPEKSTASFAVHANSKDCVTLIIPQSLERRASLLNHSTISVRGMFLADAPAHDVVLYGMCNKNAIVIDDIISVHAR